MFNIIICALQGNSESHDFPHIGHHDQISKILLLLYFSVWEVISLGQMLYKILPDLSVF
jgi:hypothetical protein